MAFRKESTPLMLRTILRGSSALLMLLALAGTGLCQERFASIPPAAAPLYHFNFARNFFASPDAEKAERQKFYATLVELEKLKGKVAATPDNLLRALTLSGRVQSQFMPHYIYLYLHYATNTKNEESHETQQQLGAEIDRRTSFLQQELMRIDDGTLARFTTQQPALKTYRFAIDSARRMRPHTLSLKEEEILSQLDPALTAWPAELYQRSLDRTQFGKVRGPGGDLDVWRQSGAISNSPDRAVREEGFKKKYAGYTAQRDLYAFALARLVKARDQVSRLKHFKDNPAAVHFGLYLTSEEVKILFERLAQAGDFNKRYQRLRADHIKKIAGYDDVNVWDMTVIPPGRQRPRFTIEEATRVIEQALGPLGSDYGRQLAALLDPANGRLDLVPGDNRVPGAFAWGFPGSQVSIFYSFNYEGYFEDVSTLAHEAGHAVHYQLMGENHVLPAYVDGPSYFFESFAMFNELVLADALYRRETDTFRQTYFLEQFLNQAMAVFPVTRQAAEEQAIYDGVKEGKLKTADDFDALTKRIGARYSMWFEKHDEVKMEWIDVHHFYDAPMYYVNYVFANFLSLKFYEMYTRDPQRFVPKYIALVRNGFNAAPPALLQKFLNVDLRDPKMVPDAFTILESKIQALQALYARQ
jgi:oligoendopeptidase F